MQFYEYFMKLCKMKDVKPGRACLDAGLNGAAYARWEKGSAPTDFTMMKIADYFGIPFDEFKRYGEMEIGCVTRPGSENEQKNKPVISDEPKNDILNQQFISFLNGLNRDQLLELSKIMLDLATKK